MMLSLSSRLLILTLTGVLVLCGGLTGCGKASSTKSSENGSQEDATSTDGAASGPAGAPALTAKGLPAAGMPAPIAPAVAEAPAPETVLLTVDGIGVTQAGFDRILNVFLRGQASTMPAAHLASARAQLREKIEERLIMEVLLDKAVIVEGVAATDEDMAEEWKKIEASLPPGMTLEQQLAKQGYDRAKAAKEIRQFLGHKKLHEKIAGKAPISDTDARAYYDENLVSYQTPEVLKARHILLMTKGATPDDKAAKQKQIDEIRVKLIANEGKDFAEVAAQVSDCPSKTDGGSLGDMRRGQMVPAFEKMAFSLSVGEISPVVETEFGYHIITLDKKTAAGTKPYEEVAASIKARLATEAQQKLIAAYHEKLLAVATVVRPDASAEGESDSEAPKGQAEPEAAPAK